jgi:hypothetical protein
MQPAPWQLPALLEALSAEFYLLQGFLCTRQWATAGEIRSLAFLHPVVRAFDLL